MFYHFIRIHGALFLMGNLLSIMFFKSVRFDSNMFKKGQGNYLFNGQFEMHSTQTVGSILIQFVVHLIA